MRPVVVIENSSPWDDAALNWATEYARGVGAKVEKHHPHDDFGAQLVVTGYQGRTRSPLGLGGHVLPLVCTTACDAVVVCGTPAAQRAEHGRITALVSGGPDDTSVLDHAADFARRHGAALRVLHAAPPPPLRARLDDHDWVLATATNRLSGFPHTAVMIRAQPHEAIARCTDTDLIVVGSGETHDCGAVTKAALHHAPCPVLVVHRPVAEDDQGDRCIPAPRRPVRITV